MYSIEIQKQILQVVSLFYRIGFWHRGDEATTIELGVKWFYCFYYSLFPISLAIGAIKSDNQNDCILLVQVSIAIAVMTVKFCVLIWKQKQILQLLNRICIFTVQSREDSILVNQKLQRLKEFATAFAYALGIAFLCELIVSPFLGERRTLFFRIGFPLDYENNEISFWIASIFSFTQAVLSTITFSFSAMVWYLMFTGSLRYQMLGHCLRNMGRLHGETTGNKWKIAVKEEQERFLADLTALIDAHSHIRKTVSELESFCSNLFFMQISTSALCICGSIYCLAFAVSQNLMKLILDLFIFFYHISEIFTITYFGNEIMLSSNRLSNYLFESNWIEQTQTTKKCILIFGECLKRPHELIIRNLYPLTLDTLTRILRASYSMFNLLKNVAQ